MRIHNINVGARAIALNIALQMIASRQHLNSFLPVLPLLIQFWEERKATEKHPTNGNTALIISNCGGQIIMYYKYNCPWLFWTLIYISMIGYFIILGL